MPRLLEHTPAGLHCAVGGFTIDPSRAVERAVITHAHADHARSGAKHVLTSASGARQVDEEGRKRHADRGFEDGWGAALDQLVALVKTW